MDTSHKDNAKKKNLNPKYPQNLGYHKKTKSKNKNTRNIIQVKGTENTQSKIIEEKCPHTKEGGAYGGTKEIYNTNYFVL